MPVRQIFGIGRWEFDDVVDTIQDEEGTSWMFTEGVVEAVENDIIPELCYLTPDNFTIYNSFLLDKHCMEAMESVSPDCRGFRCDLAHYFLNNGAQIFADFFNAESYEEGMNVVHKTLSDAFQELNMCKCGREFFKAVFKCAPYYHANALFALVDNDEDSIVSYGKVARNIDTRSASKFFDRLMDGLCTETSDGICLDSIINMLEEVAGMAITTMENYDAYEEGDRKFQKSQEKRCDALYGPIKAWDKDDRDPDYADGDEEWWEIILSKTADVANNFYCEKKCKKSRGPVYPCCMRRMMEDTKMFDNVARVIESIYKVIPATDYSFKWYGFYELAYDFHEYSYDKEEMARIMSWKVPENLRDLLMRTVHAAKYCDGKMLRCSK
jgi:hypothetical protein